MSRRTITILRAALAALTVSAAAGCTASAAHDDAGEGESETAEGSLTLDAREANHVAGRFTNEGVVLAFDYARRGDDRMLRFATATGRTLVESTLGKDRVETMRVLDGRAVVSGAITSTEPTIEGDHEALVEINRAPELKLVPPLHEALRRAGVERSLYAASPAVESSGVDIKVAMNQAVTLSYCNQSVDLPTWGGWVATTLAVQNLGRSNVYFEVRNPYTADREQLLLGVGAPWGYGWYKRFYWGFPMRVTLLCRFGGGGPIKTWSSL